MVVLNEIQKDVLKELINLGAGKGAEVLNSFLSSHVQLSVPELNLLTIDELHEIFLREGEKIEQLSSVEMDFLGSIKGTVELIFLSEKASVLVDLITGEERVEHDFDEIKAATFSEVGNVVINAVLGTISNELSMELSFTIPKYIEGSREELLSLLHVEGSSIVLVAHTRFRVEETELNGDIVIYFSLHSFDSFLIALENYVESIPQQGRR